jgi:hypothetical protein
MSIAASASPIQAEPRLARQTVVVIGGSAGIGPSQPISSPPKTAEMSPIQRFFEIRLPASHASDAEFSGQLRDI